jgi:transketolase
VLIARTTFGKGVSYMQGQIKWHYWPMSDAEYGQALREVEAMP